jgi:hypothetical protein
VKSLSKLEIHHSDQVFFFFFAGLSLPIRPEHESALLWLAVSTLERVDSL